MRPPGNPKRKPVSSSRFLGATEFRIHNTDADAALHFVFFVTFALGVDPPLRGVDSEEVTGVL